MESFSSCDRRTARDWCSNRSPVPVKGLSKPVGLAFGGAARAESRNKVASSEGRLAASASTSFSGILPTDAAMFVKTFANCESPSRNKPAIGLEIRCRQAREPAGGKGTSGGRVNLSKKISYRQAAQRAGVVPSGTAVPVPRPRRPLCWRGPARIPAPASRAMNTSGTSRYSSGKPAPNTAPECCSGRRQYRFHREAGQSFPLPHRRAWCCPARGLRDRAIARKLATISSRLAAGRLVAA